MLRFLFSDRVTYVLPTVNLNPPSPDVRIHVRMSLVYFQSCFPFVHALFFHFLELTFDVLLFLWLLHRQWFLFIQVLPPVLVFSNALTPSCSPFKCWYLFLLFWLSDWHNFYSFRDFSSSCFKFSKVEAPGPAKRQQEFDRPTNRAQRPTIFKRSLSWDAGSFVARAELAPVLLLMRAREEGASWRSVARWGQESSMTSRAASWEREKSMAEEKQ